MDDASFLLLWIVAVLVLTGSAGFSDDNLDEGKAIEKIRLLGGVVVLDGKSADRHVFRIDLQNSLRFNEKYLSLLKSFPNLTRLDISKTVITDSSLSTIGELKELNDLWLNCDQISDEGFKELKKALPNTNVNGYKPDEFQAATQITRLGGRIENEIKDRASPVLSVSFKSQKKLNETHLPLLNEFTRLSYLTLVDTAITDVGTKNIGELKTLTWLDLSGSKITDAGMKDICGLTDLVFLILNRTTITNAGLKQLSELKSLICLELSETKITDEGLKEIGELINLTGLHLNATGITDVGLKNLGHLTNLKLLSVRNAQNITDTGAEELSKTLPNLKIHR